VIRTTSHPHLQIDDLRSAGFAAWPMARDEPGPRPVLRQKKV